MKLRGCIQCHLKPPMFPENWHIYSGDWSFRLTFTPHMCSCVKCCHKRFRAYTHTASPSPPSPGASTAPWWEHVPGSSWLLHFLVQQEYSPLVSPRAPATTTHVYRTRSCANIKRIVRPYVTVLPWWVQVEVSHSCMKQTKQMSVSSLVTLPPRCKRWS